jgi:hypothetical protein
MQVTSCRQSLEPGRTATQSFDSGGAPLPGSKQNGHCYKYGRLPALHPFQSHASIRKVNLKQGAVTIQFLYHKC